MNHRLDAAYRAASYVVQGPDGPIAIRVDDGSPALDDLLVGHGTRCWAFLTACNPGSTPLSDDENCQRMAELQLLVSDAAYPFYPGEAVADDGGWPVEPSLLIVGIATEDAATLARRLRPERDRGRHHGRSGRSLSGCDRAPPVPPSPSPAVSSADHLADRPCLRRPYCRICRMSAVRLCR